MHPKQEQAIARKQERQKAIEDGAKARDFEGLSFVDIPPSSCHHTTGMTIAFRMTGRNSFEMATAVVHPNDRYSKRLGRAYSAINFAKGSRIVLRTPSRTDNDPRRPEQRVRTFVRHTFEW